jgi:hypothetical protein
MSKHREAYEALKTIANYCYGRDCETECIFFNGKDRGSVCRLVSYKFSPAYYEIDPNERKPIKERCEELEVNERVKAYNELEETRNICRAYADEIRRKLVDEK